MKRRKMIDDCEKPFGKTKQEIEEMSHKEFADLMWQEFEGMLVEKGVSVDEIQNAKEGWYSIGKNSSQSKPTYETTQFT